MTTTVLAVPGAYAHIKGSNGVVYDVVGGLVQVSAAADVQALRDVGAVVVTFPQGATGPAGANGTNGTNGTNGANAITAVNAQTDVTYAILAADQNKLVTFNNAAPVAVTIPQATGNFGNGFALYVGSLGVGVVTITPAVSTIGGGATLILNSGDAFIVVSDGTNYRTIAIGPIS